MQAYSDPKRENGPHALPDIEVFHIGERERADICEMNGEIHTQQPSTRIPCEDCPESGWYWWSCSPGCLPDGDAIGPFATEAEALADAQDGMQDEAGASS